MHSPTSQISWQVELGIKVMSCVGSQAAMVKIAGMMGVARVPAEEPANLMDEVCRRRGL